MSLDIVFTGLIVAVAAAWASRRAWRSARRRASMNSAEIGCGSQPGGCDNCLAAGSTHRPVDTLTPCDNGETDES